MTKEAAISEACKEAKKAGVEIMVFSDPNPEGQMQQDGTPYGYCPTAAKDMLAPYGAKHIGYAKADGRFLAAK